MESSENVYTGTSRTSFAEAAYAAVEKAEEDLGEGAPTRYDITLQVTATPGSSLSEYIAQARGAG